MLYYRVILYYYHWYCTVLSLYCTCGSPKRKESSPNSSSTICCKLEPPPPSSPRPLRSCGLVPSSVQVQLPVSVHRLTCATLLCSFSSITSCCITGLSYIITIGTVLYYHCTVLVARPKEMKVHQTLLLPSAANWSLRRPPRLDRPEAVAWCRLLSKCSCRCLCIG